METTTPYAFIKDGKVYLKGFLEFPDRVIGDVAENDEAAIKYFEERFNIVLRKVDELEKQIEGSDNKGSYLMKLIHLKKYIAEFDAIGDYAPLFDKLNSLEEYLNEIIAKNREKNLEIKRALLQETEALKDSTEWNETSEKFKELKDKWIKTGSVDKQYKEEVEDKFKEIIDSFFERKRNFFLEKKEKIKEVITYAEALVHEARRAQYNPDAREAVNIVTKVKEKWRDLRNLPPRKKSQLWGKLKQINDNIYEKYKASRNTIPRDGNSSNTSSNPPFQRDNNSSYQRGNSFNRGDNNYNRTDNSSYNRGGNSFNRDNRGSGGSFNRGSGGSGSYNRDFNSNNRDKDNSAIEEMLAERKKLLQKAFQLAQSSDESVVDEVKTLQEAWKNCPRVPKEHIKEIAEQFFTTCDLVTENFFLNKLVRSKNRGFEEKSEKEQYQLKISVLQDLISRDEKNLASFQENMQNVNSDGNSFNDIMFSKFRSQDRKLKVKKQILLMLNESLKALK